MPKFELRFGELRKVGELRVNRRFGSARGDAGAKKKERVE
jgi:hypothetical protein